MNSETIQYASYLVRLWRDSETTTAAKPASPYRAEVEHIQTGQRHQFHTPDDLWAFLHQHTFAGEQHETIND
jgi:hypothetical protein